MSSPSKLEANARNAQLSCGPKTEAGKAVSSQNARKHGLTAQHLVILPHQQDQFDSLHQALSRDVSPEGELEWQAFDEMLAAAWNRFRCREIEVDLMCKVGQDPLMNEAAARQFDRIQRYKSAADRAYARALKELRALQTDRGLRTMLPPETQAEIPGLASIPTLTKQLYHMDRNAKVSLDSVVDDIVNAPPPFSLRDLRLESEARP